MLGDFAGVEGNCEDKEEFFFLVCSAMMVILLVGHSSAFSRSSH